MKETQPRTATTFRARSTAICVHPLVGLEDVVGSAPAGQIRTEAITALAEVRGLFDGNPIAIDLLLRALAEPGLDRRQKAMIYGALVNGSYLGEASLSYAEAGLTLAEEIGDPELLVYCLTAFADVTFQLSGQVWRDVLERAVVLDQTTPGTPRLDPRVTLVYNLGPDGALRRVPRDLGRSDRRGPCPRRP